MRRGGGAGSDKTTSSATVDSVALAFLAALRAAISASDGLAPFGFFSFSSAMCASETLSANCAQIGAAAYRQAMLLAVTLFKPHACPFAVRRIERLDVADVDRSVLLNPAALRVSLGWTNVLPDAVNAFDHDAVLINQ